MLRFGLEHVEVEAELDEGDLMMIGGMCTHRKREPMALDNRGDFHAFAALGEPHGLTAALGRRKGGVDEAHPFINGAFLAQRIGQLREDPSQHLPLTPLLKSAMDSFVVGIALRQELPLRPGVQNPEHRFQDGAGGDGFAAKATIRDVLFGEMVPDLLPLVMA